MTRMTGRTVGVVTVGRSDYGHYLPIFQRIEEDKSLRLHLIVAGMNFMREFGLTVKTIEADGFQIGDRVQLPLASDSPEGIAQSAGQAVTGFAKSYSRFRPDILVVLGDRFEMHAAALAALPFKIPIAHIHGGELTQGAFDDALRHSLTKLSHLHFVSTREYAQRVVQLGEEPWRVVISGAPGLDNLASTRFLSARELESKYALNLHEPPILVTFHPVTLEYEKTERQADELLAALEKFKNPIVLTKPNADTHNSVIARKMKIFSRSHESRCSIDNLGTQDYFSFMAIAACMVGNSSSGIIEAPSFELPAVNIGTRQQGRVRPANVIDVGYERTEILEGIRMALRPQFRESLQGLINPNRNGCASRKIVKKLKEIEVNDRLVMKRFHDMKPSRPVRMVG